MMRGPDCATLLARALSSSAAAAGLLLGIDATRSTRWHSATFAGARHIFEAQVPPGERTDRWLASLPETDLPLRHHLVADLAITRIERGADATRFTIEALTVRE